MDTPNFLNHTKLTKLRNAFKDNFQNKKIHKQPRFWLIIFLLIVIALLVRHCSMGNEHQRPVVPAVTVKAKQSNVAIYLSALGTVKPTYSVTVRTQINGRLLNIYFKEGQMVKAGDILAQVDPAPYQAQLMQYQGQLARDSALLANAEVDLKRYQTLWRQDSVSKQILDTQVSLVHQYQGTVKLDEGLIQNTQLNLAYTQINAPISGRIGLRLVDPGNYIQTADTNGLAVINMLNPITVTFSISEDDVPEVMEQVNAGKTLVVEAYDREKIHLLDTGTLLAVDNQIDPTTGTLRLKALFQNNSGLLFPNQFVNIKLLVNTLMNVTTVATAAIQHSAQGPYVYLVNPNNTVTIKSVVTGVATNDDTMVTGVTAGQAVVVEGADKLTDGAKITVANADAKKTLSTKNGNKHHKYLI